MFRAGLHALRGHPGTHADLASLVSPVVEREKLETRSHATLAEILTPLSAIYPVHVRRYVVEGSPVEQLICRGVLSSGQGEAPTGLWSGRRLGTRAPGVVLTCVSGRRAV